MAATIADCRRHGGAVPVRLQLSNCHPYVVDLQVSVGSLDMHRDPLLVGVVN
jgi:hypothetical protein